MAVPGISKNLAALSSPRCIKAGQLFSALSGLCDGIDKCDIEGANENSRFVVTEGRMIRKKTAKKAARRVAKKTAAKDTAGKTIARKSGKRKSASTRAGRTVRTRKSRNRNLHDLLSRMTFIHACQLLGANGQQLIYQGSSFDEIDIENDVFLGDDLFRLRLPEYPSDGEVPIVTITLMAEKRKRLNFNCTTCGTHCDHIGAALSLILEEKTLLGLAEPPPEEIPFELLSEDKLIEVALSERQSRADTEKFRVKSSDPKTPWTDYVVTSAGSGKSYRVALRGEERGISYCTCPDYRTNSLGTCKHILYALKRVKTKFSAQRRGRKPKRKRFSVHVRYDQGGQLQLSRPHIVDADAAKIIARIPEGPTDNAHSLVRAITQLQNAGHEVNVYPDAERTIEELLFRKRMARITGEIRKDPANHPLREELLNATLLPYQLDGIAFAAGRGRAILADDMGLGKTIQGIGVAELLAREANVEKVLVICPTSLKSQWRSEVHRFSGRSVQLVLGSAAERASQYDNDAFLTVCNYEQVLRDILSIDQVQWDLIILDEAQRIKNWQSKTSSVVKSLRSRFALVLSGTPLENRIDELFSVVQFVDDRRLGAGFRFFNRHRIVDITGRVTGYKNLDQLREHLRPILLRRTRDEVLKQLPPRTTDIVRIEPTDEQLEIHGAHRRIVATILRKPYVSEMDMLRMQKALLMCRLAANSTFLIDKHPPGFSSKLDHLDGLLERVAAEPSRKCVLFSEWTRMLELIEPAAGKTRIGVCPFRWLDPAEKAAGACSTFPDRSSVPLFHYDQRGLNRTEPPSREYGYQRRPSVEPRNSRTTYRPCPSYGAERSGACVRPRHRGHTRRRIA